MLNLYDGIDLSGDNVRVSVDVAMQYIPANVLTKLLYFDGHYYCNKTVLLFYCPSLAVKLIDTALKLNDYNKLRNLKLLLDKVLADMKQDYSDFMLDYALMDFRQFRRRCSIALFGKLAVVDEQKENFIKTYKLNMLSVAQDKVDGKFRKIDYDILVVAVGHACEISTETTNKNFSEVVSASRLANELDIDVDVAIRIN